MTGGEKELIVWSLRHRADTLRLQLILDANILPWSYDGGPALMLELKTLASRIESEQAGEFVARETIDAMRALCDIASTHDGFADERGRLADQICTAMKWTRFKRVDKVEKAEKYPCATCGSDTHTALNHDKLAFNVPTLAVPLGITNDTMQRPMTEAQSVAAHYMHSIGLPYEWTQRANQAVGRRAQSIGK